MCVSDGSREVMFNIFCFGNIMDYVFSGPCFVGKKKSNKSFLGEHPYAPKKYFLQSGYGAFYV